MLLTISTTHQPATDLGYLLHKHPDKCQTFPLSFGKAHVFYPVASDQECEIALLLDINPITLVRGKSSSDRSGTLAQYVNDRPYVASSFMSVAIAKVFRTALNARCENKPNLVKQAIPLTVKLPVLPCRGGEQFLRQLFEPLGYQVDSTAIPLTTIAGSDQHSTNPNKSNYFSVSLSQTLPLSALLSHLYVLIPVLDEDKHYWIGEEEIEKLIRHGEGWLNTHPVKEQISKRYLKGRWSLARKALEQLLVEDELLETEAVQAKIEAAIEKPLNLNQQRLELVTKTLKNHQAQKVIDLGCGEGKLLRYLLKDPAFKQILGVDVAYRELEIAKKRLKLDRLPFHQQDKIQLIQGSVIYRDRRFQGFDAAALVEVIEHLDSNRLAALERVVFEFAHPRLVIVTTPNIEYNVRFESLAKGKLRHRDHRFEWTRAEFEAWSNQVGSRFSYQVKFEGIGDNDEEVGTPTQMAVFTLK